MTRTVLRRSCNPLDFHIDHQGSGEYKNLELRQYQPLLTKEITQTLGFSVWEAEKNKEEKAMHARFLDELHEYEFSETTYRGLRNIINFLEKKFEELGNHQTRKLYEFDTYPFEKGALCVDIVNHLCQKSHTFFNNKNNEKILTAIHKKLSRDSLLNEYFDYDRYLGSQGNLLIKLYNTKHQILIPLCNIPKTEKETCINLIKELNVGI